MWQFGSVKMYSYCVDFNLKNSLFTPKNLVKSVGQNRTILGIILSKKFVKKVPEIMVKILLIFAKKMGLFFKIFSH